MSSLVSNGTAAVREPIEVPAIAKVGVVGAGLMGTGISHVCALAGLPVAYRVGPRAHFGERFTGVGGVAVLRVVGVGPAAQARVVAVGVAVGCLGFGFGYISGWWLIVPIGGFLVLAKHHEKITDERKRAERITAYYEQAIRRIEDRRHGNRTASTRFKNATHP